MTKLTAERVTATIKSCLYDSDQLPTDGTAPDGAILVAGITRKFGFDPGKVAQSTPVIAEILNELPEAFRADVGGGWSFLQACEDKHGDQWGEHRNMEELFVLGIAADLAEFLLPREMWGVLPGGVPYIAVKTERAVAA